MRTHTLVRPTRLSQVLHQTGGYLEGTQPGLMIDDGPVEHQLVGPGFGQQGLETVTHLIRIPTKERARVCSIAISSRGDHASPRLSTGSGSLPASPDRVAGTAAEAW